MQVYFGYPHNPSPSGGLKQIRLMAQRFAAAGVEVKLLRESLDLDDSDLYGVDVPSADFSFSHARSRVGHDDIVIVPEYRLSRWLENVRDWKCRVGVYNQNGYYALEWREWSVQRRFGVEFVIAISPTIAEISRLFLGVDRRNVFVVPVLVVRAPFQLPDVGRLTGRLAVAYMPRKCATETIAIRDGVRRLFPEIPWIEIDRVPVREVAQRLNDCRVFLSTQDREGCPLPSLEAMACGCLVAGYPGTPGFPHPYATSQNGVWSMDRDVGDAIRKVCTAIEVARRNDDEAASYTRAARATLEKFTEPAVDAALREAMASIASRAYTSRRPSVQRMSLRSRFVAYQHLRSAGRLCLRDRFRATLHGFQRHARLASTDHL